jgi:hypothetical protein
MTQITGVITTEGNKYPWLFACSSKDANKPGSSVGSDLYSDLFGRLDLWFQFKTDPIKDDHFLESFKTLLIKNTNKTADKNKIK